MEKQSKDNRITVKLKRETVDKIEHSRAEEIARTKNPKISFVAWLDRLIDKALTLTGDKHE